MVSFFLTLFIQFNQSNAAERMASEPLNELSDQLLRELRGGSGGGGGGGGGGGHGASSSHNSSPYSQLVDYIVLGLSLGEWSQELT